MELTPMRSKILIIFPTVLLNRTAFSQQHRYPVEDFYHRNITIPIDHIHGGEGTFTLYYELSKNFKFEQPTIIFVTGGQQHYGEAGKVDELAGWMQFDGYYLLGDPPDYIDPVYTCMRDLTAPVVQLVEQKKVPPPEPPKLEQFSDINTEVFYQAGYYDHITPYQVGV